LRKIADDKTAVAKGYRVFSEGEKKEEQVFYLRGKKDSGCLKRSLSRPEERCPLRLIEEGKRLKHKEAGERYLKEEKKRRVN